MIIIMDDDWFRIGLESECMDGLLHLWWWLILFDLVLFRSFVRSIDRSIDWLIDWLIDCRDINWQRNSLGHQASCFVMPTNLSCTCDIMSFSMLGQLSLRKCVFSCRPFKGWIHWGRNKMTTILQMAFQRKFWYEMLYFGLNFTLAEREAWFYLFFVIVIFNISWNIKCNRPFVFFVKGNHRWPVDSFHKRLVMQKASPRHYVIIPGCTFMFQISIL